MIRNVRNVDVEEVALDFTNHLIKKMTRSSSMPKMYFALEFYAGSVECSRDALELAYELCRRNAITQNKLSGTVCDGQGQNVQRPEYL